LCEEWLRKDYKGPLCLRDWFDRVNHNRRRFFRSKMYSHWTEKVTKVNFNLTNLFFTQQKAWSILLVFHRGLPANVPNDVQNPQQIVASLFFFYNVDSLIIPDSTSWTQQMV